MKEIVLNLRRTRRIDILYLLLLAGILPGCGKGASSTTPAPVITSINPTHGPGSTTLTISGSGFSATASQDIASVNGKNAPVVSASATQLVITIPGLAGTGPIRVVVNGGNAPGPVFTYDTSYITAPFASGLNGPEFAAIDGSGNLYVTGFGDGTVSKISPTGVVSAFAGGFNDPLGITIDANGNLYVATNRNLNLDSVYMISPSGVVTSFFNVSGYIYGMAMGNSGTVYAANSSGISKLTPGVGVSGIGGGESFFGVAVGYDGTVFGATTQNGAIVNFLPSGLLNYGQSGFSFGTGIGMVADGGNNLYLTIVGNNTLGKYNSVTRVSTSGIVSTLADSFDEPVGLVRDKAGNFYVVNNGNGTVSKMTAQ